MALRAQQTSLKAEVIQAPNKGMDTRAPIGQMDPSHCVYTYNLIPDEFGMRVRDGFREHCTNLESTLSQQGVLTIIPYTGIEEGSADNRLFACTNEGIWDVTTQDAPTLAITFPSQVNGAGHGVFCHYVNDAPRDYLLYADLKNGLYIYDGELGTWTKGTDEITGTDPDSGATLVLGDVVFVMQHKENLWLIEEGKAHCWYLPAGAVGGACTYFTFEGKFPHGGRLYGLFNWSVDGGVGVDDMLVCVSKSGDVVVYQGPSPDSTEWSTRGTYFIGDIPAGRRFGDEYGGNVYLLSTFGLISMNDLLRGVDSTTPSTNSLAYRISRPLRNDLRIKSGLLGWEPLFLPSTGNLVVTSPIGGDRRYIQYVMGLTVEGWGMWRDLPAQTVQVWQGKTYFGTGDNRVCVMDAPQDEVKLNPPAGAVNGNPVEFSVLSAYVPLGAPAIYKQVQFVRPNLWSRAAPAYTTKVLYDYAFTEPSASFPTPQGGSSTWDNGLWDEAIWSAESGGAYYRLIGGGGLGRACAVAMKGASLDECRFMSWDVMWKNGGPV